MAYGLLSGVALLASYCSSHSTAIEQGELPETFYQLLVESVKVEALVGLRDAMAPDEAVPLPGQSSRPAEATPPDDVASSSRAENASEPEEATEAHPGNLICSYSLQGTHPAVRMRPVCKQGTRPSSYCTRLIAQTSGLLQRLGLTSESSGPCVLCHCIGGKGFIGGVFCRILPASLA